MEWTKRAWNEEKKRKTFNGRKEWIQFCMKLDLLVGKNKQKKFIYFSYGTLHTSFLPWRQEIYFFENWTKLQFFAFHNLYVQNGGCTQNSTVMVIRKHETRWQDRREITVRIHVAWYFMFTNQGLFPQEWERREREKGDRREREKKKHQGDVLW